MPSDSESSPPRNIRPTPPPELPARQPKTGIELSKFEPFPELEPFPFKPDPPRPEGEKKKKLSGIAIRKPAKFVRGESRESDYESDLDGARITPRWMPPGSSDAEDNYQYKKVRPPSKSGSEEPASASYRPGPKEPTPPTRFEIPAEIGGDPPRPQVLSSTATEESVQISRTVVEVQQTIQQEESVRVSKRLEIQQQQHQQQQQQQQHGKHLKPSAKAIEMEKQWSHRFVGPSKIWPPPSSTPPADEFIGSYGSSIKSILKQQQTGQVVVDKKLDRHVHIQVVDDQKQQQQHQQHKEEDKNEEVVQVDKVVTSVAAVASLKSEPASMNVSYSQQQVNLYSIPRR